MLIETCFKTFKMLFKSVVRMWKLLIPFQRDGNFKTFSGGVCLWTPYTYMRIQK